MTLRTMLGSMILLASAACAQAQERGAAVVAHVDGDHHITVRATDGHLWWAHRPWSEPHALCNLPGEGPVLNLAVRPIASGEGETFEITFDQDGAAWRGRIILDDEAMLDTPVAFLRGTDRLATGGSFELARSGR